MEESNINIKNELLLDVYNINNLNNFDYFYQN